MITGIPKEVKNNEYRVAIVPAGVRALVQHGHRVLVEKSAGVGSGISDEEYIRAGAEIRDTAGAVFDEAEMIIKVKEPLPQEYDLLHEDQVLFTYLHLAPAPELTQAMLRQKIVGIAYETVQLDDGSLPLLVPMSQIAGRLATQVGAYFLQKENGGSGVLLGGVPGVKQGSVVVIGGGTVGTNAAMIALGMGADVTILDININRLGYLTEILSGRLTTEASNELTLASAVASADLVIGALLIPGAKAKKVVMKEMMAQMRPGSVVVDVAVDQGGCTENCHPTTHEDPTFIVDGVVHYCVANMPGAVARTSTFALTNVTFPYALALADKGWEKALEEDKALRKGLNVLKGDLTCQPVADALGLSCKIYN